jgi:hypothetical protein
MLPDWLSYAADFLPGAEPPTGHRASGLRLSDAEFPGGAIINADGTLNRRQLREYIFSDSAEKAWLNALLHPIIWSAMAFSAGVLGSTT